MKNMTGLETAISKCAELSELKDLLDSVDEIDMDGEE